jgi:hypothetical protein
MHTGKVSELTITQHSRVRPRYRGSPWFLAALSLAAIFLVNNLKIIRGTQAPIWDAWAFYGPEFTLIADHARAGHFLLWDPWVNGGTPDHADPTVGAASPIEILIAAIAGGTRAGFTTYWLLIWFLGPLSLLILGRHLDAPAWGTWIVALGYAFCSFYTGHAEHTSFIYSFSFIPLFIWRLDKALGSKRLWPAAQAGALWGLSALGGYPQLTFLSACFLCLWAVGRCCFREPLQAQRADTWIPPRPAFALLALVLVFLVGTMVLAPSYVGLFTEGAGYTDRIGALPRDYAISSNELDPGTLLTFASPYLHLLKYPGLNPTLWPKTDPSAMGTYVGALPFILALFAIVTRPTAAWRLWLLGIVVFALACAVGDHLPVRGWLYDFLPPTRYFRHPAAFRAYAIFATAVLAMVGTQELQLALRGHSPQVWRNLAIVSFAAASAAILSFRYAITWPVHLPGGLRGASNDVIFVWAASFLTFLLALISPGTRRVIVILLCFLAMFDVFSTARISRPFVSDGGFFAPLWRRTDANHRTDLMLPSFDRQLTPPSWLGQGPTNASVPLRTATLFNDATMANHFHFDIAKHPVLSGMATGSNRIWFADTTATVIPSDAGYELFVRRAEALGVPVLLLHRPEDMVRMGSGQTPTAQAMNADAISKLPPAHLVAAELVTYAPNQLKFNVQCPGDGWLLVTDRWSRGWVATVNDLPVQIFGGNFIFRAIPVRAGENNIQFSYDPFGWWSLLLLSWSTLLVAFVGPCTMSRICRR